METKELVLINRDGKRMPATLQLQEGETRGTVVLLHGLGGWRNQSIIRHVADAYASWGYHTVRFDESNGVNNPEGDFFHETTTQYTRDVEDVMDFIKAQPWCQKPITMVGHSMGGLVATWYAATHPARVDRLVLLATTVSWKLMWWSRLPGALIDLVRGHRKLLGIDGKHFAVHLGWWKDFFAFDGGQYASQIEIPTLTISAERDYAVATPGEHRRFARRFPHADHSTISWADHDFTGHEDEVVATIRQWHTSS